MTKQIWLILFSLTLASAQGPRPDPRYIGPKAPDPTTPAHNQKVTGQVNLTTPSSPDLAPEAIPVTPIEPLDSGIDRLSYIRTTDAEFQSTPGHESNPSGFFIKNNSPHHLVGLAVVVKLSNGKRHQYAIDGISTILDVPQNGTVMVSRGYLKAFNSDYAVTDPDTEKANAEQAMVSYALFDDGEIYGTGKWLALASAKIRHIKAMLKEIDSRPEARRHEYIQTAAKCLREAGCRAGLNLSAADLSLRDEFITEYQALYSFDQNSKVTPSRSRAIIEFHRNMVNRLPELKGTHGLKEFAVVGPQDAGDWAASLASGSCASGSTPEAFGVTVNHGCYYPATSGYMKGYAPTGGLNTTSPLGYWAGYDTFCSFFPFNQSVPTAQNEIVDRFTTLKLAPGISPVTLTYYPRENIFANVSTGSVIRGFGPADWTLSTLAGLIEPYGPVAGSDGGVTFCSVTWTSNISRNTTMKTDYLAWDSNGFLAAGHNGWDAVGSLIPPYLSFIPVEEPFYGYVIQNRRTTQYCDPNEIRTTTFFQGLADLSVQSPPTNYIGPNNSNGFATLNQYAATQTCTHTTPQRAASQCNPNQSWCCCMATYSNWDMCVGMGMTPDPNCTDVADAQYIVTHSGKSYSTPAGVGTTNADGVGLGIARSGAFLLDTFAIHSYDSNLTTYVPTGQFAPPGGLQSTDVPVAGDWTGDGITKLGYYRPATGVWYFDTNNDHVWDAGDVSFSFGGISGDVPVVGDWLGGGKDCAGIFRYGYYWVLDTNCNGTAGNAFGFGGEPGDVPVVGRWIGGNHPAVGVGVVRCYVPTGTYACQGAPYYWVLDYGGPAAPQSSHGVGLGTGCGYALSQQQYFAQCLTPAPFAFGGIAGDVFVTGDWFGENRARAGVYRSGTWLLDDGTHAYDAIYQFGGVAGDKPLVGRW